MMLDKRFRPVPEAQSKLHLMPDYPSDSPSTGDWPEDKHKFCNAPRIFIGFSPKGSSDSEGAKSPTSPLDMMTFSGAGIADWHENRLDSHLSSPKQKAETIPIDPLHGFTCQTGMEHSESYTCVISHGPKSTTKHTYSHFGMKCETVKYPVQKQHVIWDVASPPRSYSSVPVFPVSHFLSACHLCKRKLSHEKDIYMYRGDKAFCSVECRYQQILMDERM